MVGDHLDRHQFGVSTEALRKWGQGRTRRHQAGASPPDERERLKPLERNREFRRASETLRSAAAFFETIAVTEPIHGLTPTHTLLAG